MTTRDMRRVAGLTGIGPCPKDCPFACGRVRFAKGAAAFLQRPACITPCDLGDGLPLAVVGRLLAKWRSLCRAQPTAGLAEAHRNVLLVTHGLMNYLIAQQLRANGWHGRENGFWRRCMNAKPTVVGCVRT